MADDAPAAAEAPAAEAPAATKTPADFLKNIKGKPVVVKLNSGVDYKGERRRRAAPPASRPPRARLAQRLIPCPAVSLPLVAQGSWRAWTAT
jgi:hypothetical protein